MQSLDLIRKRIRSIEATRKITNAMKLVATTKIKAQRDSFEAVSAFCYEYYRVFKRLILANPDLSFLRQKPLKTKSNLYILVASDLGLCGPYNPTICKHLLKELKPEDKVIIFGSKGEAYLKSHHVEAKQIIKTTHWNLEEHSYYALLPLSYDIVNDYVNSEYDQIKIVYTEFKSSVSYKTKTWNILPIWPELFGKDKKDVITDNTIFEPNARDIMKHSLPVYVSNLIYGALVESKLCESSSRRFAMEGATKNAQEMIDMLKIQYNQARQEAITQEINEIVAGAAGNKK